jgi:hypothetical protein
MADKKPTKVIVQFDKCPWCGSKKRLGDHLLAIARQRGLVSPEFQWYPVRSQLQPPIDPLHIPLIGSSLPTAVVGMDWCLGCGRSYTVKIVEGEAQVTDAQIGAQK